MIGSGVCVFSRFPIIDAFTYRYSLNGYMYNITHGDWFGGKAAGYCLIDHPKQPIHFFSTHVSYNHIISALHDNRWLIFLICMRKANWMLVNRLATLTGYPNYLEKNTELN